MTRDGDRLVLEVKQTKQSAARDKAGDAPLEERIAAERARYQQMRPALAGLLSTLKPKSTFRLPGKITDPGGFETTPTGALRATTDGARMLAALDELVADDSWWRELVRSGRTIDDAQTEDLFRAKAFGSSKPYRAVVAGPLTPQFDYAAEVAEARQRQPAMLEALKLPGGLAFTTAPAAGTVTFRTLTIAGVQLVSFAGKQNDIHPLNKFEPEHTLCLVGEPASAGKEFGAVIKSVEPDRWTQGNETLELNVQLPKYAIRSVTFYDATGAPVSVKSAGTSWSGASTTLP